MAVLKLKVQQVEKGENCLLKACLLKQRLLIYVGITGILKVLIPVLLTRKHSCSDVHVKLHLMQSALI